MSERLAHDIATRFVRFVNRQIALQQLTLAAQLISDVACGVESDIVADEFVDLHGNRHPFLRRRASVSPG